MSCNKNFPDRRGYSCPISGSAILPRRTCSVLKSGWSLREVRLPGAMKCGCSEEKGVLVARFQVGRCVGSREVWLQPDSRCMISGCKIWWRGGAVRVA